ncbi:MAG: hypothetical protein ACTSWY_11370 [Promethearchaeota archaeon]
MNVLNRDELYSIRKEKLRKEIEAARRILNQKIKPLQIADELIHDSFELLRDGILNQFPGLKEKELHQKIKKNLLLRTKFKLKKKRENISG